MKCLSFLFGKRKPLIIRHLSGGCKLILKGTLNGNDVYVHNEGCIVIGEEVWLNSYPNGSVFRTALNTYSPNASIEIGDRCKINGCILKILVVSLHSIYIFRYGVRPNNRW